MRFLLVDRITSWSPGGPIRGVKSLTMSEDFLEHHFPGHPVMPGALLLEAMVQLAGWLVAAESSFRSWFLLDAVRRSGFHGFVLPGDTVEFEVRPLPGDGRERRSYVGVGLVAGGRRVEAEFAGPLVALAELEDPAEQERAFAVLSREGRG